MTSAGDDLDVLRAIVGPDQVLTDPDVRASYELDWTRRFRGQATAVVRPASADDVVAIVRVCAERRWPIVPQGGNTGLVGGSVPVDGGIVLSTSRMAEVCEIDLEAAQVTVEAGVTLAALAESLRGTGWELGVDLGARESATIGGMVATNAGGIRVLRYGSMRANVVGVEAVLGDGSSVRRLGGLVKDNTGYDLAGLLCGSEGTLGVVTAARLRLVPAWPDRLTAWVRCSSWADAVALAARARREVDGLDGLEAVDAAGLALVRDVHGVEDPLGDLDAGGGEVGLLIEWAGRGSPPDSLGDLLGDRPHAVASEPATRARLWALREQQTESIARSGVPHKLDVTLPLARLAGFTDAVRAEVALVAPGARLFLFGHVGDGNLHVNVLGPDPDDPAVDDAVLALVSRSGGSISAEHGIGRLKAAALHLSRSPEEIAAFRALKAALDPAGILNPGVLLAG